MRKEEIISSPLYKWLRERTIHSFNIEVRREQKRKECMHICYRNLTDWTKKNGCAKELRSFLRDGCALGLLHRLKADNGYIYYGAYVQFPVAD